MIRPARLEDSDRLGEIHVAGWRAAYRGRVSDQYLFRDHRVVKSTAMFREQIPRGASILVHEEDGSGIVKGFLWTGSSRDADRADASEVYAFYVQPEFRGQGVGSQLMAAALERLGSHALLWVLRDNAPSIGFYRKFGFVPDGQEKVDDDWEGIVEVRLCRDVESTAMS